MDNVSERVLNLVDENPALQSALYDMDLLPEQIDTDKKAEALTLFAAGFALGKQSKEIET